ncbi:MAG: hypothetical protein RR409_05935 [Clostridium sp.]
MKSKSMICGVTLFKIVILIEREFKDKELGGDVYGRNQSSLYS